MTGMNESCWGGVQEGIMMSGEGGLTRAKRYASWGLTALAHCEQLRRVWGMATCLKNRDVLVHNALKRSYARIMR